MKRNYFSYRREFVTWLNKKRLLERNERRVGRVVSPLSSTELYDGQGPLYRLFGSTVPISAAVTRRITVNIPIQPTVVSTKTYSSTTISVSTQSLNFDRSIGF